MLFGGWAATVALRTNVIEGVRRRFLHANHLASIKARHDVRCVFSDLRVYSERPCTFIYV